MKSTLSLLATAIVASTVAPLALSQATTANVLEEVIVTARKREENLQDTPISITAISAETLANAGLKDLRSIEGMTPNLSFTIGSDGGGSTLQAFIRGVGQVDFLGTTDPGVGIYVDGVYLARTLGANLEFSDIERIEVLRGPQGTLFGKNTIGGAINVTTRAPSGESGLSLDLTAGDYGYSAADFYGEVGVSDTVAVSLSAMMKKSDGWQKRAGDDAGNDDMWGLRAHLNWTPSDSFRSHLVIDRVEQDQNVYPRVLSDFDATAFFPGIYNSLVGPVAGVCCNTNSDIDRSDVLNKLDRDDLDAFGLSWTNAWEIGEMTLKSVTGYRDTESQIYRDSDNQSNNYFSVATGMDHDQFSQEFLLSGAANDGALDWLVGVYYFTEDGNYLTDVTVAEGLYEVMGVPPLDLTLRYDRDQKTENYAAFFNSTWQFAPQWRLNVAARYTWEEKDMDVYSHRRASAQPFIVPGQAHDASECGEVTASGIGSRYSCKEDWSEFSPKIGLDYVINDDAMVYAHVSRGFRSGVFNGRPLSNSEISTADPETLTSFELGFKSQWWDSRFQLNGSVFYNDYEDQQFLVNRSSDSLAGGLALVVDNAGESTLLGYELEFAVLPAAGLMVSGGLSYLDPEYDKFESRNPATGEVEDLSHRPFANTPEWNANLAVQYDYGFAGGANLMLRTDLAYKSEVYYTNDTEALTFDRLNPGGFSTINAGVIFRSANDHWELGLQGRNLSDKRVINGGFAVDAFGSTDVSYTGPRCYFVNIKYKS